MESRDTLLERIRRARATLAEMERNAAALAEPEAGLLREQGLKLEGALDRLVAALHRLPA